MVRPTPADIDLHADARGYISLPNHTEYDDLVEPLEVRLDRYHNGPGYMVSVFHQLHCLVCLEVFILYNSTDIVDSRI